MHKLFLDSNLRFLRKRKSKTQEIVSQEIGIDRALLARYETGTSPSLDVLVRLSDYYSIGIDYLLRNDLSIVQELKLRELESNPELYIKGKHLRVLTTTVNQRNEDNIELVNIKARAGYVSGYADPDYVSQLPTFSIPFLDKSKKYRAFQITGDSMLPMQDKSYVIGKYIEDFQDIKDGKAYIIITREEGILFKIAYNYIKETQNLLLVSMNTTYRPFEVNIFDVMEAWEFVVSMEKEIS